MQTKIKPIITKNSQEKPRTAKRQTKIKLRIAEANHD